MLIFFCFDSVSLEQDEDWDSPFQWRETVSSQITTSLLPKEPPKIASPYTTFNNQTAQSSLHLQRLEKIIHLPYTRDPDEPMRRLSSITIDSDYDRHERRYFNSERELNSYKPSYNEDVQRNINYQPSSSARFQQHGTYDERRNSSNNNNGYESRHNITSNSRTFNESNENGYKLNNCSKPANNDFEYIKSNNVSNNRHQDNSTSKVNPIAEMQSLARKSDGNQHDNDEAPFNFQGILRKTNINRESIKRSIDRRRNSSIKYEFNSLNDTKKYGYCSSGSMKKYKSMDLSKTEVAPGVYMEGRVIEL